MAKDDQQEAYERLLASSLARTIDFLKFAEAKNAALLTFSSAWLLAIATHEDVFLSGSILQRVCGRISESMFLSSALIALWAFLPRRKLPKFFRDPEAQSSLVYFGDAAKFEPSAFTIKVKERYYPEQNRTCSERYLSDLSIQIVVNSKIADDKFSKFHFGGMLIFAAFVFIAIPPSWSMIKALALLLPTNGG